MTDLKLRLADIQDAEALLRWRNDRQTRAASHNNEAVSFENHVSWLTSLLEDSSRQLFVAEIDGTPVGTVRADLDDHGVWELSWTIAPEARGKSVAKQMVSSLASEISEPIRAEVKKGNVASIRIAEHAGMVLDRETDGVLHFLRGAQNRQK